MGGMTANAEATFTLRCPTMHPAKGFRESVLSVLMISFAGMARAEDCRYGHGDAVVRATSPNHGYLGRGVVLIDKGKRWVGKLPWIVQDRCFEPTWVILPDLPCESCLVYWDIYVPVAGQAVWHISYAGELLCVNGVWQIRYYATATLHSFTA
jgi:hypothetical protein